ncbi:hypothetical protein CB1_001960006 [Camelus ferus]|nr:hypothetical protein CB1_001960006 [Camelus ferus]
MPGLDSPRTGLVPERGLVPGDSTAAGGAAGAAQLLSPRGLSNMAAVVFPLWTLKRQLLILFNVILISEFPGAIWFPKTLPCDVTLDALNAHVIVDCTDKHLTEIPGDIPTNATNLTLTINHIADISPASFHRLDHLLDLSFNYELQVYHTFMNLSDAFSSLKNLKVLRIKGYVFKELKNLSVNKISPYDENARSCRSKNKEAPSFLPLNEDCYSEFQPLVELKYLDFSNNRLDLLYSTAFEELQNLEVLDISSNSHYFQSEGITHMLDFTKNLKVLRKLMMNYNDIATSTSKTMESESLRILEFRGNHLDVLWRDGDNRYLKFFKNLLNLEELDISENSLSFLPGGVFDENVLNHLNILFLHHNRFLCNCDAVWFVWWVNHTESIQLSKKTVFVMTDKYAKTENFKVAFYLSHQRLMDEKEDVIILIFLEKPLQKSKFLQLRKRLCGSSVLEWPSNPQAHPYFWQCLKNALATDNHVTYSQVFKETA